MTAADLQQYIGVIDRMKSLLNSADFDQVFGLLTSDLPKSKQFLLKMELKRMAQPCNYFIDLRGHVDGDVKPYDYMGKTHYMDATAVKVFEAGLKQYGSYTLGLYEEVLNTENNFRVMHRRQTEYRVRTALTQGPANNDNFTDNNKDKALLIAKQISFGHYATRRDERMHFSIDVELDVNGRRFSASTSDLSVSGCKVKLANNAPNADAGQHIKLHFTGLEQEFMLGLADGVGYKLVDVEQQNNAIYWRLQRLPDENEQQFANFLQNFINGNKRRYKVNLDNVCQTLSCKGYEQFYLPRINSLPVFIAVRQGQPIPVCALTTDYNKPIWQYFLDEQHQAVFHSICHVKRLKALLQLNTDVKSTVLYSFTHAVKGKLFFYSATTEELQASEDMRQLFLGFGASKPSWRVFQLVLCKTHPAQSEVAPAIPEQKNIKMPAPLSQQVKQYVQDIRYIVSFSDITGEQNAFWYQSYPVDAQKLKLLAQFGHKKLATLPTCDAVAVQYVNLRSESRYLYKTSVSVVDPDSQAELTGYSRDFSSKGMQIETTLPVRFKKGDVVLLMLPDMQKISNKYDLSALPYEVMAVSKSHTIMNLRAVEGTEPHQGRLFFQQLIQSNRAKLTQAEESPRYPGLSGALRNMYLTSQHAFGLYIHRKGIRYEISTVGKGYTGNSLHKLLTLNTQSRNDLDLSVILQNNAASLHFAQQLKQMKRFDTPKQFELFVVINNNSNTEPDVYCRYDYEFSTEQAKQDFVLNALPHSVLFSYRLMLSRTGRPDTDFIGPELNYISTYAIHKAKQLEEELWSVAGVIDVVDISAELPWRYGATITQSEQQQVRQQQLLAKLK